MKLKRRSYDKSFIRNEVDELPHCKWWTTSSSSYSSVATSPYGKPVPPPLLGSECLLHRDVGSLSMEPRLFLVLLLVEELLLGQKEGKKHGYKVNR